MKKKILLLTSVLIALSIAQSNCQTAATLLAHISPSGGSIAAVGSYYLGFDVVGNITIDTSDVILDLNGHVVNGRISVSGSSNVTIRNGHIQPTQNFQAITASECTNLQLNNLTITPPKTSSGVSITSTTHISIKDVIVDYSEQPSSSGISGITLNTCTFAKIDNCVISGKAASGFVIQESSDIVMQNCLTVGAGNKG